MNGIDALTRNIRLEDIVKEACEKADLNRKYARMKDAFRYLVKNYGQKNGLKETITLLLDYGCSPAEIEDLGFEKADIEYIQKLSTLKDKGTDGYEQMRFAIS